MDEMKIRTKFLKGLVSKVVGNVIKNKLGTDIELSLNDLQIEIGDSAHLHLDMDVKMRKHDLELLIAKHLKF